MKPGMNPDAVEAIVQRLLALRRAGDLTDADVVLHAKALDVSRRTLYRWLAKGTSIPTAPPRVELTGDECAAFFEASGNAALAHRLLGADGDQRFSVRTYQRAIRRSLSPSERAYARTGERARRSKIVREKLVYPRRNMVWQLDHVELPIEVFPPRGAGTVRPSLTPCLDCHSRLVAGFVIQLTPTAADVLTALRHAVLPDERYGPAHGIPDVLVWDNGREFLAEAVTQVAVRLGCAVRPTRAYTPHLKGIVERFNRTIQQEFVSRLPGYTDGRRDAAGRLYSSAELTYVEFCQLSYDWIEEYNLRRPHSALDGKTPAEVWLSDPTPIREAPLGSAQTLTKPRSTDRL